MDFNLKVTHKYAHILYIYIYLRIIQIYNRRFPVYGCREIVIIWMCYKILSNSWYVCACNGFLRHTRLAVGCVIRKYKSINMYISSWVWSVSMLFFLNLCATNTCILVINVFSRVLMEKIKQNWLYFRFALKRFMKLFIIIIICIFTNGFFFLIFKIITRSFVEHNLYVL